MCVFAGFRVVFCSETAELPRFRKVKAFSGHNLVTIARSSLVKKKLTKQN